MKRFINLAGQETGYRFAWFDTVTSTFEGHGGEQAWDTWEEFAEVYEGSDLERYRGLCPPVPEAEAHIRSAMDEPEELHETGDRYDALEDHLYQALNALTGAR